MPSADFEVVDLFKAARAALPQQAKGWTFGYSRRNRLLSLLAVPADNKADLTGAFFFPLEPGIIENATPQNVNFEEGKWRIQMKLDDNAPANIGELRGVLVGESDIVEGIRAFAVNAVPQTRGASGLAGLLLLAFAGGLILNLMPCVFPVLGLKIMGFVNRAGESRGRVAAHGGVYTAGVFVSFWILAGILLLLRSGGNSLGWGFQLQEPAFVFVLMAFLFIFALNLSGVFEFGYFIIGTGQNLQRQEGLAGSFFSGVLATVVATPCAAPFLAPALGAALALPPVDSLSLFTAIALGLSSPYLALSFFPELTKRLPQPGAWMESFRQVMAFPFYGTVAFLLWVMEGQVDENGLLRVLVALPMMAFGLWVLGRWSGPTRGAAVVNCARLLAVLVLAGAFAMGWPRVGQTDEFIQWETWSEARVVELREQGRPVYVDFTARWCATCLANKAAVFTSKEVNKAFREKGIVALKADWTHRDPKITDMLERFGKAAVPVNLLYIPGQPDAMVLPELLAPGIILDVVKNLPNLTPQPGQRPTPHRFYE
jgi:thiol:disulfide interchange protein DsbD